MTDIKISIIIPIYNSEKYIEKCIESVLAQTINETEVILIDDGSKDCSGEICQKYAEKYPERIIYKQIKNSGAAKARNIGLSMATGEYIGFVDSDDYVVPDMFEKLYEKAVSDDADIVACRFYGVYSDEIRELRIEHMKKTQYGVSILENSEIIIYGDPFIWNKIFRRSMLNKNNINFDNLKIFEDMEFTYMSYIKANKISLVDEALYYYNRSNEGSVTKGFGDKFNDLFKAMSNILRYSKDNGCYDVLLFKFAFITFNHAIIRFKMKIYKDERNIRREYIKKTFYFMDKEFPDWRSNARIVELKSQVTEEMLYPKYWIGHENVEGITIKKFAKRLKKLFRGN